MNKNWNVTYSIGIGILLGFSFIVPAFAEVITLDTSSRLFFKDDEITFTGTVEKGTAGLVSIVIRDINDEFVLLTQATINSDNSFERKISVEETFSDDGIYNATGFILTLTKGITTQFKVSPNTIQSKLPTSNNQFLETQEKIQMQQNTLEHMTKSSFGPIREPKPEPIREPEPEPIREPEPEPIREIKKVETQAKVQDLMDKEVIPEAEALSIAESPSTSYNNSEIVQISFAIGGLMILFGAVYGIKQKVDGNSKQISINRNILKKNILQTIMGSNPKTILQRRLAKGEITLQEYEILKAKLS